MKRLLPFALLALLALTIVMFLYSRIATETEILEVVEEPTEETTEDAAPRNVGDKVVSEEAVEDSPSSGDVSVLPVSWPPESEINTALRDALPSDVVAEIDEAGVPVLLSNLPELAGSVRLFATDYSYDATASAESYSLTIISEARGYPPDPSAEAPAYRIRGDIPAYVYNSEGRWFVSWNEFGVAYALILVCSPPTSADCNTNHNAIELAESLKYVGGSR